MIIDFRLRPPYGGFLEIGMYADKLAADFYARNIALERAESARHESMDMLLREMDENGISAGVATGRIGHRKGNLPNDELIRLMREYPGKFVGLAGLDASDVEGSTAELHRVCIDGPLRGVVLEPGSLSEPLYITDHRIYPIYEECQRFNVPVMLMFGGRAGPDRSYSRPELISRLAFDFPGLTLIAAHGGWPFVQEMLGVCYYQENIHISPDLYFHKLPGQDDYIRAAATYMQDRFLFGSGYPFLPLSWIQDFKSCFSPEILKKILCENAMRILGVDYSYFTSALEHV